MRDLDNSYWKFFLIDDFLNSFFDILLVVADADDVWFDLLEDCQKADLLMA